jgi:putative transposase
LDRQFKASKPNQLWVTDITYIPTNEGWLYLATVMDLYSRKIVGWAMDKTMTKALVLSALKMAYRRQKPGKGVVHHSDRGVQYASLEYQALLKKYDMIGSMSRKGNCYDNACIESFHAFLSVSSFIRPSIFLEKMPRNRCSSTLSFSTIPRGSIRLWAIKRQMNLNK